MSRGLPVQGVLSAVGLSLVPCFPAPLPQRQAEVQKVDQGVIAGKCVFVLHGCALHGECIIDFCSLPCYTIIVEMMRLDL